MALLQLLHPPRCGRFLLGVPRLFSSLGGGKVPLFIDGDFVPSRGSSDFEVRNPATQVSAKRVVCVEVHNGQELLAVTPQATTEELRTASDSAQKAFKSWRNTPIAVRQRYMFKLQQVG